MMRRMMSFWLVLALVSLVVGCAGDGAVSEDAFTPPPAMLDVMLQVDDVPGAEERMWLEHGVLLTGCTYAEMVLNSVVSSPREGLRNTTAEYRVGGTRVYETLIMQMMEGSRGGRLRLIKDTMNSCDGTEIEPYYGTLQTSGGKKVEQFSVMPANDLPEAVAGFTSVVTADDGAQVTIQRIFVPILTEGDKPGLLSLATIAEGGSPGSPSPMDLLDAALARAGATIDTYVPEPVTAVEPEPTATSD